MADEICKKYHREGRFFDEIIKAGEEYILEELDEEVGGLAKSNHLFPIEVMFWTGYLYRYWHFYTDQDSKDIYKIADADRMNESLFGFHMLDAEMAIDDLMEIHEQLIPTA